MEEEDFEEFEFGLDPNTKKREEIRIGNVLKRWFRVIDSYGRRLRQHWWWIPKIDPGEREVVLRTLLKNQKQGLNDREYSFKKQRNFKIEDSFGRRRENQANDDERVDSI